MNNSTDPCAIYSGAVDNSWYGDVSAIENEGTECVEYEKDYVDEEMIKYVNKQGITLQHIWNSDGKSSTDFNKTREVFHNYSFNTAYIENKLPIDYFKQKILSKVNANQIVILQGPTGCGKTTRVPQYILDDSYEKREYCSIVVTQPRKIAAVYAARRVSEERNWLLGSVCGYQVQLQKRFSSGTLLTYMTTGVLLQKIISAKSLDQFTHIIIDDVHQRSQELDFLLIVVRRFIFKNIPKTKVILMSAVFEAEEFAHYFRCPNPLAPLPATIIYIDKGNRYIKSIFYIEEFSSVADDITKAKIPEFEIERPSISEQVWNIFICLVSALDKIDRKDPMPSEPIIGSVLVFLPGLNEIEIAKRRLLNHIKGERRTTDKQKKYPTTPLEVITLHSSMPIDSHAQVFYPPSPGCRKVILSTNIAESSITIPDSYYVIDFCLTKMNTVDPVSKYLSLKLEWASHVNCEQRAARVGRTGNGIVYRLVSRTFYNENMPIRTAPEITRTPLDKVVLQSKMLDINECPEQILALALNPPDLKNIKNTILTLKEIGALRENCRCSSSDGDLTFLGTVMGMLPIDVRLSKLIVLGHLFGCLEEAIIIAAGCSIQNIFSRPFQQKCVTYKKLLLWADGSSSDFVALLNLFRSWQSCGKDAEYLWSITNFVSLTAVREWNLLITEIGQRLKDMNIKNPNKPNRVLLSDDEKLLMMNVITAGAFYPNYFLKVAGEVDLEERKAVKDLGGRDPTRTVYFTGMDPQQPGDLYVTAIKDMFKNEEDSESDVAVEFECGSSKVYVEFKPIARKFEQKITSNIPLGVYEAVRKRQLNYPFNLKLLPEQEAWEWAERNGMIKSSTLTALALDEKENCAAIPLDLEWIDLDITEHISAGHFWAVTPECKRLLLKMLIKLNTQYLRPVVKTGDTLKRGKLYAAKYFSNELYYRCKIISFDYESAVVLFIDQGGIQPVKFNDICYLPDIPEFNQRPLCIECILHGIRPSRKENPKGAWAKEVNNFWMEATAEVLLCGRVHSVVHNVVYLELFKFDPMKWQLISINERMLEQEYAEPANESFLSNIDHARRQQVQKAKANNPKTIVVQSSFDQVVNPPGLQLEVPEFEATCTIVQLKGPHSPLEMRICGCIADSANKIVTIDESSVNAVLLDTDPFKVHNRLLVAGHVGKTGNGLMLRQTSLLPSIPGFPMLMALLFCPTMKATLTEDGTRVASVLCGLGYDHWENQSLYPSHDLTLTLDTELAQDDINKINQIRLYMNRGIKMMRERSRSQVSQRELIRSQNSQKRLWKDLKELILTQRKPVDRACAKFENDWQKNSTDSVVRPNLCSDVEDIWPQLSFIKLNDR